MKGDYSNLIENFVVHVVRCNLQILLNPISLVIIDTSGDRRNILLGLAKCVTFFPKQKKRKKETNNNKKLIRKSEEEETK